MTARFDPFQPIGPRWYAIEAHRPFLEDLAAGVLDWLGDQAPETLSDATILLPNRRAARAFTRALGKLSGDRPVLLPQVRPLGDLEEDEPPFAPGELGLDLPPAIAPLTRRFELARLVAGHRPELSPMRALDLAQALGRFLDSCQLEEIEDLSGLEGLVDADMAEHWLKSVDFLRLATDAWPRRLAELGLVDPAWRRATLLRRLADAWAERPPTQPVIAAGSTGTAPAAADVLSAVAEAPMGCVVLPGLDFDLDAGVWDRLGETEQHPQNALWRLLDRHDVAREVVHRWPAGEDPGPSRRRFRQRVLNEALRPPEATSDWRTTIVELRRSAAGATSADPIAEGLKGLTVIQARAEEETAGLIALMMRETLETPDRTCALVTPDLELARRVSARLERWGIVADDSGGRPLSLMPAGTLIQAAARWLADPLDPQALLAVLKHPLTCGIDERALNGLERYGLRGPRRRDWPRLRRTLLQAVAPRDDGREASARTQAEVAAGLALIEGLKAMQTQAASVFVPDAPLDAAARALTRLVETLAGQDVWAGRDGEAAAALLSGLIEAGPSLGSIGRGDLVELIGGLLDETTVRTGGATHPRLRILGPIEARLVRADRMILAGLEDGVWPTAATTDPFLSRPMRERLGLPPPERRLGQTAQDFVQAACAEEAILIHRERRGGQPAVKSRWLWRLEMLTRGADTEAAPVTLEAPSPHLALARALDAPTGRPDFAPRPKPTPPVDRRPRELPVTGVERWVRDPYATYARYVLRLKPLDRPGQSADALLRGQAIHKALERFVNDWPHALPDDTGERINALLIEELVGAGFDTPAMARETPLAANSARWLAGFEAARRARGIDILTEQRAALNMARPGGAFRLTAKIDRVELSATGAAILDFKTGAPPGKDEVKVGFAPQLTLTGAILAAVGVGDAGPVEAEELTYVRVIGRRKPGEIKTPGSGAEAAALSQAAFEGLCARIDRFDDAATPYLSWVAPKYMGNLGGNYDHLARVWEWMVVGGETEASE